MPKKHKVEPKKKKKRSYSYSSYIYKVLKQVHPDTGITNTAMAAMNSFINDAFDRMCVEAGRLARYNKKPTLNSREIQSSVRLVLSGELAKHAVAEGTKAVTKTTTTTETKNRPVSRSEKAGLILPVSRLARAMRIGRYASRYGYTAPAYLAAVLEYLAAEVLELAGNAARDNKRKRVTPRHITLAVRNDEEINKFLNRGNVTIGRGGVLPGIHKQLLRQKSKEKPEAAEPPRSSPLVSSSRTKQRKQEIGYALGYLRSIRPAEHRQGAQPMTFTLAHVHVNDNWRRKTIDGEIMETTNSGQALKTAISAKGSFWILRQLEKVAIAQAKEEREKAVREAKGVKTKENMMNITKLQIVIDPQASCYAIDTKLKDKKGTVDYVYARMYKEAGFELVDNVQGRNGQGKKTAIKSVDIINPEQPSNSALSSGLYEITHTSFSGEDGTKGIPLGTQEEREITILKQEGSTLVNEEHVYSNSVLRGDHSDVLFKETIFVEVYAAAKKR